jgi:hypothetical protein
VKDILGGKFGGPVQRRGRACLRRVGVGGNPKQFLGERATYNCPSVKDGGLDGNPRSLALRGGSPWLLKARLWLHLSSYRPPPPAGQVAPSPWVAAP